MFGSLPSCARQCRHGTPEGVDESRASGKHRLATFAAGHQSSDGSEGRHQGGVARSMPDSRPSLPPFATPPASRALATPLEDCAAQLRTVLHWELGEHREIRVISKGEVRSNISHAVVASPEEAASAIQGVAYGAGVYVTMNPVRPGADVLRKAGTTLTPAGSGSATFDVDIERRKCFVIDLDPVRDADTSATNEQLAEARAQARTIVEKLHAEGWPKPTEVCSGNGVHIYYRIDLEGGPDLPQRALRGLHERFSTAAVKVDTTVANAARIMRIPGTWTAKGGDRSLHRTCTLEVAGEDRLLTREQLEAVALQPVESSRTKTDPGISTGSFDVPAWLQKQGVKHRGKEPWPAGGSGAHRWVLDVCPFNPAHNRGEAVITQQANGAIGFTCHHDSCSEHGWKDFRKIIEVAAQVKRAQPWSEPRPPYPVDALPPTIRDVVRAQVAVMTADEASIAVPIITALLGVAGNAVVVEPMDEWREPMVAWTALVAPSGEMKSATIGIAEKALHELEAGFPPPLPDEERERLVVNDTTVEALGDVASTNPRGLVLYRDELAGFVGGIGQYKRTPGADEAFWLSAYEGKRHSVDRRSTGSTTVPQLLVSVLGGIQPSVLRGVMSERNRGASGFAARFWFVWPPRRYVPLQQPDASLSDRLKTARTRLGLCLESLRKIPMPEGRPTPLRLEQCALSLLLKFANEQREIAFGLTDVSIERSCREKARGWVAKVAALIALLRAYEAMGPLQDGNPTVPDYEGVTVRETDVEAAIRLIEWQVNENARVHRNLRLDDLDLELERKHGLALEAIDPSTGSVTVRDFVRKHGVGTVEGEQALRALVAAKLWGERYPKPGPQGGRPTVAYFPLGDAAVR